MKKAGVLLLLFLFFEGCGGMGMRSPMYVKFPKTTPAQTESWDVLSLLPEPVRIKAVEKIVDKKVELLAEETTPKKQQARWMNVYLGITALVVMAGMVLCFGCKSKWGWPTILAGLAGSGLIIAVQEYRAIIGFVTIGAAVALLCFKLWEYHTERDVKIEELKELKEKEKPK